MDTRMMAGIPANTLMNTLTSTVRARGMSEPVRMNTPRTMCRPMYHQTGAA